MPTTPQSLFEKVWNAHAVKALENGQTQLFIGTHLIHEVTSPQAFGMLRDLNLNVRHPERTFATVDHIVPTSAQTRPFIDLTAEEMTTALERNCRQSGIQLWAPGGEGGEHQGIVHVIGPELGLTQPGMTIACGDSHTSTHGALGAIAFGIGTSQGMGGFMGGRGTTNLLTRTTAILGTIFFALSLTLALLNRGTVGTGRSLLDNPPISAPATEPAAPALPRGPTVPTN